MAMAISSSVDVPSKPSRILILPPGESGETEAFACSGALRVTEAAHGVVVHHPGSLHEAVASGWADELEALLLELTAHVLRLLRTRGDVGDRLPAVDDRPPAGEERLPEEAPKAPVLLAQLEHQSGVDHRGRDLASVPDDPRAWQHQPLNVRLGETRHGRHIKAFVGRPICFPFPENGTPAESSLEIQAALVRKCDLDVQ